MASKRELLLLQLLLLLLVAAASSSEQLMALPGCRRKCGNIAVPYPFGIGPGCFRGGFDITCDGGSPRALIPDLDLEIEITDISLAPAEVRAKIPMSYQCYNETAMVSKVTPKVDLTTRPAYIFSSTRNKFTALGCFTLAHLAAYRAGPSPRRPRRSPKAPGQWKASGSRSWLRVFPRWKGGGGFPGLQRSNWGSWGQ